MPGSGVAVATCLWRPSCLQSCFSIQQWSVALRFEVAPPCRELITWQNEQALAAPEKCLGEQRLLGRVRMQQQSPYSKTFVMVGNPRLESYCILCNAAESKWKKTENLEVCVLLMRLCYRPGCYLFSGNKLKHLWIRCLSTLYTYRRSESVKMLAYSSECICASM